MNGTIEFKHKNYQINLAEAIDISIPLRDGLVNPNCFYAPPVSFEPLKAGDFVGAVSAGAPVNFFNVRLNPHGNGTHTECVGHIAKEPYTINQCLTQFAFPARLMTVYPQRVANGDRIVQLTEDLMQIGVDTPALVLRTMPNTMDKQSRQYSGTNPPYLEPRLLAWLVDQGVDHLLLDLPSVDREQDEGVLAGHHAFWTYPTAPRTQATITEMVYIPDAIKDGLYLLHFQIAAFELDVSPSKPVLYQMYSMKVD
ncbi:MAG: cyclase family protein [Bacteroidota bacterium]